MDVTAAGWTFLVLVTVFLPFAAIRGAARARASTQAPTRGQYFASFLFGQGLGVFTALAAASYEWIVLFPAPNFAARNAWIALAFLVPTIGTLPIRWSWRSVEEKRRMMWLLPNRTSDLVWWMFVALVAGVVEEIVFRGVMFTLWTRVLGSWWPAVIVCSIAFALSHFVQGWRAVLVIAVMAIGNHWIVRATGDLYTAMAVHFAYDLIAGIVLLGLAKRDGIARAVDEGAATASEQSSRPSA
jgi:membrane protease YdiL (CAAX protease family)